MHIRKAKREDFKQIKAIFKGAIKHMSNEGNTVQWQTGDFLNDQMIYGLLDYDEFYVCVDKDEIVGFYKLVYGIEPTYNKIQGFWLNDTEYVVVHKFAVKYFGKGIADYMLKHIIDKCKKEHIPNIRVDTYKDNTSMKNFLINHKFLTCGVISITKNFDDEDSLRLAFQLKVLKEKKYKQPKALVVNDKIKLVKYYKDYKTSIKWYLDPKMNKQIDNKESPYTLKDLENMYEWCRKHGEVYYVEIKENNKFKKIGDLTLFNDNKIALVIDKNYQNRGIGCLVIKRLLKRAKSLKKARIYANVYSFNTQSQRLLDKLGFVKMDEENYIKKIRI